MKQTSILLLALILICGCSQKITPDTFQVKYYASYSSSAGIRILNITYIVDNEEIISCDGDYTTFMTDGMTTYGCDIEKLKTKQYNVPLELITEYSQDNKIGEITDGPSFYKWEIAE